MFQNKKIKAMFDAKRDEVKRNQGTVCTTGVVDFSHVVEFMSTSVAYPNDAFYSVALADEKIRCDYCTTKQSADNETCVHCGAPL